LDEFDPEKSGVFELHVFENQRAHGAAFVDGRCVRAVLCDRRTTRA
jgi:hypothetical protein